MASFTDKLKAGIKNTDSLAGQKIDEARINSAIGDQRVAKSKLMSEAAEKMFCAYIDGATELTAEVKALFDKAKACDAEITKLEQEKKDLIDKAHSERESRRNE